MPQNKDWAIDIRIYDPTGRIPINALSDEQMSDLLEEGLGFDFSTTQELKDTWTDWIDADDNRSLNGAESDDYESLDPPYRPANRPIESLDELKLIQTWKEEFFDEFGQPNELYYRLQSMVTTLHNQPVNVNSASPIVLDYLLLNKLNTFSRHLESCLFRICYVLCIFSMSLYKRIKTKLTMKKRMLCVFASCSRPLYSISVVLRQ